MKASFSPCRFPFPEPHASIRGTLTPTATVVVSFTCAVNGIRRFGVENSRIHLTTAGGLIPLRDSPDARRSGYTRIEAGVETRTWWLGYRTVGSVQ